jgi:aquaporin Z
MTGRKFAAELLGTFVLVFGGIGTAVLAGEGVGLVGISFAFGLSLLVMAYAIGPISGCHINPAVTLGVLLRKGMTAAEAGVYWLAQVIGGVLGALLVLVVAKGREGGYDAGEMGLGANGYGAHSPGGFDLAAAFTVELALTALLVFVVLGATHRLAETSFAGLPIGFALVLIHLVSIPVTNTSVNPARSIGPAVFVGDWAMSQLWLFIVAPLVGAIVGWGLHHVIFGGAEQLDPAESAVAAG